MFRSKRNSLVKRLWKYRINNETKSSTQRDATTSHLASTTSSLEDLELKSVTHLFFKRLKEEQLEALVQAMECKGGEVTPCVPVSKSDLRLGKYLMSPYVLCCRVFRWPDLKSGTEMKRLPSCTRQNEEKESVICCNPYHWSIVVKIDEPPIHPDKLLKSPACTQESHQGDRNEDGYPGIIESTETGLTPSVYQDDVSGNTEQSKGFDHSLWCTVAYWELRERVGRLFSVTDPSVHIFQQLPHGDGMCLRLFQKPTNLDVVKRTREKIGFGIILSREAAQRSNTSIVRIREMADDAVSAACTGISVSPLSQPFLSSSPSPQEVTENSQMCNTCSSSTSNFETLVQRPGVTITGDNVDCISDVKGEVIAGCDGKDGRFHRSGTGCCLLQTPEHHYDDQQLYNLDSSHEDCYYGESMDYMPGLGTSPPCYQNPHLPLGHVLSRSPSCLSSSSFSSSPSSSPPSYFNNDTSFSDYNYSGASLNYGTPDHIAASHITSSSRATAHMNNNEGNSKNSSAGSFIHDISGNIKSLTPMPATNNTNVITSPPVTVNTVSPSCSHSSTQGEVWVYNASNFPIFVNSPTLDDPHSPRSLVVKKVPPGYSIKIFDYARAELLERTEARNMLLKDGPFDPCCVRISLAKGWGPSYSRQFITSCPCWLEILLGVHKRTTAS